MNNRGLFISDIPFFSDWILYYKAKRAAKALHTKYRHYIVHCILDYLNSVHTSDTITIGTINTPERLWDSLNTHATSEGITIAMLIEKAVAHKLNVPIASTIATPQTTTKKLGRFELPRA